MENYHLRRRVFLAVRQICQEIHNISHWCEKQGWALPRLVPHSFAILGLLGSATLGAAKPLASVKFRAVTANVSDVDNYKHLSQVFEAKTGIHVEITPVGWGSFDMKYMTSMAAGLPPDCGITNTGGPFKYGKVGGVRDFYEFGQPAKALEKAFDPNLLRPFRSGAHLFGIPAEITVPSMMYRTDIFDRLGLEPPKTWDDLDNVLDKLESNGYRYYYGWITGQQWSLGQYTLCYDLAGIDADASGKGVINWNNPKYQEAIFRALNFWYFHDNPGDDLESRAPGMFASNTKAEMTPLLLDGNWLGVPIRVKYPEVDGKWKALPLPYAKDGHPASIAGGTAYVIFTESKHPKEGFQWVQFLNSRDSQRYLSLANMKLGTDSHFQPPAISAMYDHENDEFWKDPLFEKANESRIAVTLAKPSVRFPASVIGSELPSQLESSVLDRMKKWITDQIDEFAQSKGLSRSEVFRKWGSGEWAQDRERLRTATREKLKQEYAAITPQAQKALVDEGVLYEERYGKILRHIDQYKNKTTILEYSKIAFGCLLLGCLGAITGVPKLRKWWASYLFIAAPLGLAIWFVFLPAVVALYLSFTEYHPVMPLATARFISTENYQSVIANHSVSDAVTKTAMYALQTLPLVIGLSLGFAWLLNYGVRPIRLWRFLYFAPMVTSAVSVTLIFQQLFLSGRQGWINALFLGLHLTKEPIAFLKEANHFPQALATLAIWQGLPFTILIFLAGLQQIPAELYEAAEIDGASQSKQFRFIAIPGLRPQIYFVTVLGVIGASQVFDTIYLLADKSQNATAKFGPNDSSLTMVPLIYRTAFENSQMGKANAVAYILFAILLILTAIQFVCFQRKAGQS